MTHFKILPTDRPHSSAEITAIDASAVLHILSRLDCSDADVLADNVYSFSVHLDAPGFWTIFQRDQAPRAVTMARS
jgi:hypothetical protein